MKWVKDVKSVKGKATALFLGAAIFTASVAAQDKPSVPFTQVVDCARAGACRNMTSGKINWFDVVGIPVLTFRDNEWTYDLRLDSAGRGRADRLTIYLTPPEEKRATQRLSLDLDGRLVTSELGPQPGERVPSGVDYATWVSIHRAYAAEGWHPSGKVVGEEFRPFWQKQADQALAAIQRQLVK